MHDVIGVDAGGTSTRAVVVDERGRARGMGRAGGGNPTSAGLGPAVDAVTAAIAAAVAAPGVDPAGIGSVLLAHAGSAGDGFHDLVAERIRALGVVAPVTGAGDVTALFCSGSPEPDGVALIAGTGSIAGVVRGGRLVRTVDGTGWLLGDEGSGFWIGHRVARAAVDDLDGGPSTALTAAVLERVAIPSDGAHAEGRPAALGALIHALYALKPVQLSGLAPLAFAARADDPVAAAIVRGAVAALARVLARARALQPDGPLVLGGSVLVEGYLRLPAEELAPLLAVAGATPPVPVPDGLVGAAVLALRASGLDVDASRFATLVGTVRAQPPG